MIPAALLTAVVLPTASTQAALDAVERITETATVSSENLGAKDLGTTTALDGDRALVTDWGMRGSSRVLELRLGKASIELVGELRPDDPTIGDEYGRSVALDGDVALIGAPSVNGPTRRGAAYVFRRGEDGWRQDARLESDTEGPGWFGSEVAIAGDRALVAAESERGGSVHAFVRETDGWRRVARLMRPELGPSAHFGAAVAFAGEDVVISTDPPKGGFVFTYRWGEELVHVQTLELPPDHPRCAFGEDLALDGEHLLVGADGYQERGRQSGWVFTYRRRGERWEPGPPFGGPPRWWRFGRCIAISGDTAAIGVMSCSDDLTGVLVYRYVEDQWCPVTPLTAAPPYPEPEWTDTFGESLALHGQRVLVGDLQVFQSQRLWSYQLP